MCCYSRRHKPQSLVLLILVGLSAATDYYVKPTTSQETSCPRESCYTLDELARKYFYASATDVLMDNVTVFFLNGTHAVNGSIFVREVNNFTLLGAGGMNGESQVEIDCKRVSSLVFDGITNLTITRITFSQCGVTYQHATLDYYLEVNALTFSSVFNLRLVWVVIQNSTKFGIFAVNVLGASLIDHSVLQSFSHSVLPHLVTYHIFIKYNDCNQFHSKCSNKTKSIIHAVNSHKLEIHNSLLRDGKDGSMKITYYHVGYKVELDIMGVTILNGGAAGIDIRNHNSSTIVHIMIQNCIIMNISGTSDHINKLIRGQGLRIDGYEYMQVSVVLRNVSFENNKLGGLRLHSVTEIELIDCKFVGNQGTSIDVRNSILDISGTLSFVNNTAYKGAAVAFNGEGYMSVSLERNTQILFMNNYAEDVGGAIFAEDPDFEFGDRCFLQLELATQDNKCSDLKSSHQLNLVFTNNTAQNGGDAIYGGSLYLCTAGECEDENNGSTSIVGAKIFNSWNLVQYNTGQNSNLSLISSAPSRVCLCEDGEPDCRIMSVSGFHYPGETFSVSAVVVGQGFGTVYGTVYAWFINKGTSTLEVLQKSQQVKHNSCTELEYTVFSNNKNELVELSVRPTASEAGLDLDYYSFSVSHILDKYKDIKLSPHKADKIDYHDFDLLLQSKFYINITLLPCPPGFMLSDKPAKCVCHDTLQQQNITCNIDDQTVHRGGTIWVNASFAGNESNGVIVHHHCPYGYCKLEELDIRLDFPDTQCRSNHSGILCGGCRPGLSLTLGTSKCLRCSNKYIALLILFALAGIVLVAFIKLLDLTVSVGTLNGLILYANIIGANQATFFPSTRAHCPVLTAFIAWLNLDLGIETCFIDGLNGYWKTWLQFVFPVYIWIVTAVIIVVAHYSSTGARFFGNNSVQVLVTLFLLSYTKLLRTIITSISFTFLDYPEDFRTTVWLYDGNVLYSSPAHAPLLLVALTVFLFLWIPYTMVLLFMQCIRKKSHHRFMCCFARLKPLFDAYFGPLKDKHCYWVGIMLLARALLLIISAVKPNHAPKLNLFVISGTTLLLLAYAATIGKVYKKRYISFLENSFLLNLGALAIGSLYTGGNDHSHTAVVHMLVGIAFLQFVGIISFHGSCCIKKSRMWRHIKEHSIRCTDQAENRVLDYQPFAEEQAQPVRLRMTFNELREPVLEYAEDST